MRCLLIVCLFAFTSTLSAQPDDNWLKHQATAILPEAVYDLADFIRIPNNGNIKNDVIANLGWCFDAFKKRGFEVKKIETEGMPLLYAEWNKNKRSKTVLFYMQIDGQPVDSAEWDQPSPYEPVIKKKVSGNWETIPWNEITDEFQTEWRIFGRSASDSKGPALSFLKAWDVLRLHSMEAEYNVKVIMDFQEELGSPDLAKAVKENSDLLSADFLCIMDGTRHTSNLPTLTFGARGIATIEMKVFGPRLPLHSGQYGNYAPNPVFQASKLIASMKGEDGKVLIPGYYDGIEISDSDKKIMNSVPENSELLNERLGISVSDNIGSGYQESLQFPSLNIRGLKAAWTAEEVRTIIPSEVEIEIDIRLVPETDGEKWVALVRDFVKSQGFHLVDDLPSEEERKNYKKIASFDYRLGSKPFRTSLDSPINDWLSSAFERAFGQDFVRMRTTGGSQPIAPFIIELDIPAVSIRIPNPDNSIHAPNENLRLGNYEEGIVSVLSILTEKID